MTNVNMNRDQWYELLSLLSAAIVEAREFGADEAAERLDKIRVEIRDQVEGT